jgi:hypothetical protein
MQDLNNMPVTKEEEEAMDALSRLATGRPLLDITPTTQDILNNMAIPQPEPTLEGIVQNICTQLQLLATVINQTKAQPNTTPPEGDQSLQECVSTTLQQAEWFKEVVEEKIGDMDFDYQIESAVETHFSNSFCLDDHVDFESEVSSRLEEIVEEKLADLLDEKFRKLRISFD